MVKSNLREESENKLQNEQSHCDKAQPGMQRIEVRNRRTCQIVRIKHSQKSDYNAWNGAGVEKSVGQLHVDMFQAAT